MIIKNETTKVVSWFCYNDYDVAKLVALKSGVVGVKLQNEVIPPKNDTRKFFVRFTVVEGGIELAGGTCGPDQSICIEEVEGSFRVSVENLVLEADMS